MGRKVKIGKQRRDKYYKLAKEAGFRSRAAFKLIQLNKRFEFLQNARATVDLCAAPGGWMQVAAQNMPVSSLIIGVDLVPIKPVANCITLQGDITTEKTTQAIKKELQRWEADCVLHDGAPNVGLNWVHDAFQQNCLVLSALRLATQILRRNGTFVTKVFRSSDYSSLITTFEKLFNRVHVWKPAASRLESAEIFVVCEKYLKPAKVPPEFLDHKKVFAEQDGNKSQKQNPQTLLLGKKERKTKAEGYADETLSMYRKVDASTFIQSQVCVDVYCVVLIFFEFEFFQEYLELLERYSEIILDQEKWRHASETTEEIRQYLRDLKVCGPRELRKLLRWRKAMRGILEKELKAVEKDNEMAEIDKMIAQATEDERLALKKRKKKLLKTKAKILKRRQLKMIIEGDHADQVEDIELFSLKKVRRVSEINKLVSDSAEMPEEHSENDDDEDVLCEGEWEIRERANGTLQEESGDNSNFWEITDSKLSQETQREAQGRKWFQKEEIAGLLSDEDDDIEIDIVEKYMGRKIKSTHSNTGYFYHAFERTTITIISRNCNNAFADTDVILVSFECDKTSQLKRNSDMDRFDDDKQEKEIDCDDEEEERSDSKFTAEMAWDDGEAEDEAKKRRLTPEQLALGELLIYSSKSAREVEEWGWNRYANNDEGLPDWFVEDEKKHYRKQLPVTKEQVEEYRKRLRELNARPCKKVAEAKERKRRKLLRRMETARKKAEGIVDNENLEPLEKVREMKKIYAAASRKDRRKTELVVMTKGKKGRISRPNGRYKLVDSRMKKDLRALKKKEKTRGRGKKSRTAHFPVSIDSSSEPGRNSEGRYARIPSLASKSSPLCFYVICVSRGVHRRILTSPFRCSFTRTQWLLVFPMYSSPRALHEIKYVVHEVMQSSSLPLGRTGYKIF
ncbi:hypothetical protein Angca_005657 [Angiostrongylus cantonensis]|nr:hypothetical protein Angca_005657 [Angiostrongylus cantonensis]